LPAQSLSCHRTSNNARIATPHPHGVIFTREVGRLGVPQLVQLFLRGIIETRGDVGLDIAAAHQSLEIGTGLGLLRDHLRRELSSRPCCLSLPRSCSSAILAAAISSMSLVAASLTKSAVVGLIPRVELVLWRMSADALEARDGVRQERRFRLDLSDRCDGGQTTAIPNAALRAIKTERASTGNLPSGQPKALTGYPQRRHFAVEPVLLLGECHPGLRHAHIALERGPAFGAFRELTAVLGVVSKNVRLSHTARGGNEPRRHNRLLRDLNVSGTASRAHQATKGTAFEAH
jgi:hypothetical protein